MKCRFDFDIECPIKIWVKCTSIFAREKIYQDKDKKVKCKEVSED